MKTLTALVMVATVCATGVVLATHAQDSAYKNLRVLPADISPSEMDEVMLENLRGLGLRRLGGEGCLYCHAGDMETPRSQWDYASDEKPMKHKARAMIAMTRSINEDHLNKLPVRIDPSFAVNCMTCHTRRTDPRPLPTVLWSAYEDGGIDAASAKYRDLHARHFGAGAYDFRAGVLPGVARGMASQGNIEDAIALTALNVEFNPEVASAKRSWLSLELERLIDDQGVDAALAELAKLEPTLAPDVVTSGLLDGIGWRRIRSGRVAQGRALLEANLARFPGEYIPIESMAFVFEESDRKKEAIALLESWLEEHPDHARGRRLLINLREQ